jgi:hypothetical protein
VHLTIKSAYANVPAALDRFQDKHPFWGGAYIGLNGTNRACTSGFAVSANTGSAKYILTAAHCGGGTWSSLAETLGSVSKANHGVDAELIATGAGSGDSIYEGRSIDPNDTRAINSRPIHMAARTHDGDVICESGSFSGSACGWSVIGTDETIAIGGVLNFVSSIAEVVAPNHIAGIGNGDSGGPVYTQAGPPVTGGVARGTMTAYSGDQSEWVSCNGVPNDPNNQDGRHCSWRWFYPDVTVQIDYLGVHLNTK